MDGALDGDAQVVATNSGLHLYAGLKGDVLYVATEDAGEGNDHLILLAREPGALRSAMWAKAGQVAAWDAFLADENNNDYEGWFDALGSTQAMTGPNGGVLEGTINLRDQYGSLPAVIHLAMAPYATADGGGLIHTSQVPASADNNRNVDAGEYVPVLLCDIGGLEAPADFDDDCDIDQVDFATFRTCITGPNAGPPGVGCQEVDLDGDLDIDQVDFGIFQQCLSGEKIAVDTDCTN
jgi:hypothetical protein